jgi:hypothetical protein
VGKSAHASRKTVPCRDKKSGFGEKATALLEARTRFPLAATERGKRQAVRVIYWLRHASRRIRNGQKEVEFVFLLSEGRVWCYYWTISVHLVWGDRETPKITCLRLDAFTYSVNLLACHHLKTYTGRCDSATGRSTTAQTLQLEALYHDNV